MEMPSAAKPTPSLIVYGLDQDGRPKAGTFTATEAELARKGAAALGYTVIEVAGAELEGLAGQLPPGKAHEPGKAFIPFVRKDLYERIPKPIENRQATSNHVEPAPSSIKEPGGRARPDWSALKPGDLVLAHESPEAGWWEATVAAKHDQTATLRWRDFPLQATVERPRSRIVPLVTY